LAHLLRHRLSEGHADEPAVREIVEINPLPDVYPADESDS
jgi:hypothetical protein